MKKSELKIGLAGAGRWGKNLLKTFHRAGVLKVVAEPDSERRAVLESEIPELNCHWVKDLDELVGQDLDGIALATPASHHFQHAQKVLAAHKHVFVEKPMTLKLSEAQELQKLVSESDRSLMVGHLLIYQPAIKFIRESLEHGLIGSLKSVHQRRLNFGTVRSEENALWSLAVHDLAVLQYLIGKEPKLLSAVEHAFLFDGVGDDYYLHLSYPGNIQAHLHCSWIWSAKDRGMHLIGSEGILEFNEARQQVWLHKKKVLSDRKLEDQGSELIFEDRSPPLDIEVDAFLDGIINEGQFESDAEMGYEVIRVLEMANQESKQ